MKHYIPASMIFLIMFYMYRLLLVKGFRAFHHDNEQHFTN